MFQKVNNYFIKLGTPFTNVYGLGRSLLGLSTLITLLFNDTYSLFKPVLGLEEYPYCSNGLSTYSIFCLFPQEYLYLAKTISIIVLVIIISGWRPRVTGILHWWIGFSVQNSMTTLDGGDQITAVLSFLLIPMTLADERKWHWAKDKSIQKNRELPLAIGWAIIFIIQIQIAILYLHSSIAKLKNPEWINGTAVYYYLNDPMLGINPYVMDIVRPIIESDLVVIPTWGTIILQFLLFCGLFSTYKVKRILFLLAITMHELFAFMLGLVSFSIAMIAALILYLLPINTNLKFDFNIIKRFIHRKEVKE